MLRILLFAIAIAFAIPVSAQPIAVDATSFIRQEKAEIRSWVSVKGFETTFLQAMPDTRKTHDDKLIRGENFSDTPGELAVLTYEVNFPRPGRYFVWVRAYSTGTEDNGIHVGLNKQWPESGQRMQW